MASLLFYENPVALSKENHKNTKLNTQGNNFDFARNTNSVLLAGVEFTEAAKEYPIVFAQAGEATVPVALLGLRAVENLFVDADGSWQARYIPAFVRRYPFVLGETGKEGERMVCIDESFAGFSETEGEALFENDQPTPVLKQAMEFLEEYQRQYVRTEQFVKRLLDNDLLKSLNAQVDLEDGNQFGLSGLMVVDEAKLLLMSDDEALAFFKSGELAWVYCHLMSLGCMSTLLDRLSKLRASGSADEDKGDEDKGDGEKKKFFGSKKDSKNESKKESKKEKKEK